MNSNSNPKTRTETRIVAKAYWTRSDTPDGEGREYQTAVVDGEWISVPTSVVEGIVATRENPSARYDAIARHAADQLGLGIVVLVRNLRYDEDTDARNGYVYDAYPADWTVGEAVANRTWKCPEPRCPVSGLTSRADDDPAGSYHHHAQEHVLRGPRLPAWTPPPARTPPPAIVPIAGEWLLGPEPDHGYEPMPLEGMGDRAYERFPRY